MGEPQQQNGAQQPKPLPPKPTIGRVVLYRLPFKDDKVEDRAADVVYVWNRPDDEMPMIQLHVKLDGSNDTSRLDGVDPAALLLWRTSVHYDEMGAPGTWRWMPYQLGQAAKADAIAKDLADKVDEIVKRVTAIGAGLDAVIDEVQALVTARADSAAKTPRHHQDV
jgi:hypothetical protein